MRKLITVIVSIVLLVVSVRVSLALQSPDVNGDQIINAADLKAILTTWLSTSGTSDIDQNSRINSLDAAYVIKDFGQPVASQSPDPSPLPITNLFTNGDFEQGTTGWSVSGSTITSDAQQGSQALHITSGGSIYNPPDRRTIKANTTYKVTYWIKFNPGSTCSGECWGGYSPGTDNSIGAVTVSGTKTFIPGTNINSNQWYKQSYTISNASSSDGSTQIFFRSGGGSGWTWNLVLDDVKFFAVAGNTPPVINPTANVTSGVSPLAVQFTANDIDYDGTISTYQWTFGDGSESRDQNPTHTFQSGGTRTVTLSATDDSGATTTKTLTITVTDSTSPSVSITSPVTQDTYTTSNSSVNLSGTANAPSGQISKVIWDNVTSGDAGIVNITAGGSINWNAGTVNLKPGTNEILITATNSNNRSSTDKIVIERTISDPSVSNISVNTTSPKVYEKYEVSFDVTTMADNPLFMYEPNPPKGAEKYNGVTVEGIITLPNGQVVTHPAFYMNDVQVTGTDNYTQSGSIVWKLRYSPQQTGAHQVSIKATDKSGTVTTPVGSFTAQAPTRDGFIEVSQDDTRYFEYSNGKIHWPIGMTWRGAGLQGTTPDGINLANSVLNYDRPWMSGYGAYTTRWSAWYSTAEPNWGNEGAIPNLSFTEHYPGHELSHEMTYPEGYRILIGWIGAYVKTKIIPGTTYQVKIRAKTDTITGPVNTSRPFGLVLKSHGFWSIYDQPDSNMNNKPSWITPITGTHDWSTFVYRYTAPSGDTNNEFSIYLDNVTAGSVWVDEVSIRPVNTNGTLGGELIFKPRADWHTYVEQRAMAFFDRETTLGEQNGVNLRYVVHDKNDLIQNMLDSETGIFVGTGYGDGYYQAENTKATWLLKQWWRYVAARLGYSTAIFGWELNNEGPPEDGTGSHSRNTQIFAKWMHDLDAHPHLANTSFWCCWRPTFWKNANMPDVDFGDIHHYAEFTDMVAFYLDDAIAVINDNVGKPVVMGEKGVSGVFFDQLSQPNTGVWYHNMLWSQLHYSSIFEIGYWFGGHVNGFSREAHAAPFYNFVKDLDMNQGGYANIAASSSQAKFRIFGQKNLSKNEAHGWVNHLDNTWQKVLNSGIPPAVSGTVTFTMNPNRTYTVSWYDTYTGNTSSTQQVTSNSSGVITLNVNNLSQDVAFKIN